MPKDKASEQKGCPICHLSREEGNKYCSCGKRVADKFISKVATYCPSCIGSNKHAEVPLERPHTCRRCGEKTKAFCYPKTQKAV